MIWNDDWRAATWSRLGKAWDLLIVGGGITGAGILREATRLGLCALLVEQNDFASGTSSRSSKLVHGGFRYLKNLQIGLTRASVQERERLLEEGPGLIDPLGFLLATYKDDRPPGWVFEAGLTIYDLLALHWSHRRYHADDFRQLVPSISATDLQGGFRYGDAQTDDARLVLRVIREACRAGAVALNYVKAEGLLHDEAGRVNGARLRNVLTGELAETRARWVINATGAWADKLRAEVGWPSRIRPLRGSHLVFPASRFPLSQAVTFLHPQDRRPVFAFPWEGITLIGTTDVDHSAPLDAEPAISPAEVEYLLSAAQTIFPALDLTRDDIQATYAGVRPVIGTEQSDPSKESREHVIWEEDGLLTVTGGKLTTFRLIALDALKATRLTPRLHSDAPALDAVDVELPSGVNLNEVVRRRLLGRYGAEAPELTACASEGELAPIPGADSLWAEVRWAARAEGVTHLDDLLLRRVRLGLFLPAGGQSLLDRIGSIAQAELGWNAARWKEEVERYQALWERAYWLPGRPSPWRITPPRPSIPARAWRVSLRAVKRRSWLALLTGLPLLIAAVRAWRKRRRAQGQKPNR